MKEKVIIFGAAGTGQKIYEQIKASCDVVCFVDNNEDMWGRSIDNVPIVSTEDMIKKDFDYIYIGSMCGLEAISNQLIAMGIPRYKLRNDLALVQTRSRVFYLENAGRIVYKKGIEGAVAEAGVYRGDFAKEINRVFFDRKLYLFDTFEGFSETDILKEQKKSHVEADYLKDTSVELVLGKMVNKDNCIIKKGFFPETAKDVEDKFVFVSLDMDLYQPTLEGLRFFYPRMQQGGMIAIHDFFSEAYPNIENAVYEYEKEIGKRLNISPVGDDLSISIIK